MLSAKVIATPATLPASSSSTVESPFKNVETRSPALVVSSSSIVVKLAVPKFPPPPPVKTELFVVTRSGASLIEFTVIATVSVLELNWEVPPFVEVSTFVP